jgi:hypothetical protein
VRGAVRANPVHLDDAVLRDPTSFWATDGGHAHELAAAERSDAVPVASHPAMVAMVSQVGVDLVPNQRHR